MNALGIDHGDKRMGIAGSDALGMMAHPLEMILAKPFDVFLKRLEKILAKIEPTLSLDQKFIYQKVMLQIAPFLFITFLRGVFSKSGTFCCG